MHPLQNYQNLDFAQNCKHGVPGEDGNLGYCSECSARVLNIALFTKQSKFSFDTRL